MRRKSAHTPLSLERWQLSRSPRGFEDSSGEEVFDRAEAKMRTLASRSGDLKREIEELKTEEVRNLLRFDWRKKATGASGSQASGRSGEARAINKLKTHPEMPQCSPTAKAKGAGGADTLIKQQT